MKILELAARIDKSLKNEDEWFIFGGILEQEFGIFDIIQAEKNTRLKSYWVKKWLCTDSDVGRKLYFFDDKFVATSNQSGRKNPEYFAWVSKKDFNEVKNYMLSLLEPEELTSDSLITEEDLLKEFEFDKERIL